MFINKSKKATTKDVITVEDKVAFLQQPSSYPYPVSEVKVKETHMSWVFLVNDLYKLKKSVRAPNCIYLSHIVGIYMMIITTTSYKFLN